MGQGQHAEFTFTVAQSAYTPDSTALMPLYSDTAHCTKLYTW